VDKTLEKATNLEQQQMQRVIKVALLCAQPNPENRPSMSNVLDMLLPEIDTFSSSNRRKRNWIPIGIDIGSTTVSDTTRYKPLLYVPL
jgi:hypothetical protein